MKKLSSFFITLISSYIVLVTGIWGFVEAYTYFQGDSLKGMLGGNWVWLYILPAIISLFIAVIRVVSHKEDTQIDRKPDISPSKQNVGKYFKYKGLLWKRGRFRFQYPTPICPIDNCYRPIDSYRINPPQYLISSNLGEMQDFLNKQNTYQYVYKCPLHGEIQNTSNESPNDLTRQAKHEQNR